jgi:hypothetical protein
MRMPLYGSLTQGKYFVQSLYAIVNFRGFKQVYTPVLWKIPAPSRLHIFLWLLANNKTLTRDNLAKRRKIEDPSSPFCREDESVAHLFFNCCVAKEMWREFAEILGVPVVVDFESTAKNWLRGNNWLFFMCVTLLFCGPYGRLEMSCAFRVQSGWEWEICLEEVQVDQELEAVKQARGGQRAGESGTGTGSKKCKGAQARMGGEILHLHLILILGELIEWMFL